MSDAALLQAYREKVIALRELQEEIARCGGSGAPVGLRGARPDGLPRGTNDPAAARQLADGLEVLARRQKDELDALWPRVLALTSRIDDARVYMIAHSYYVLGQSIDVIAQHLYVSVRTVARMKKAFLDGLGNG